MYEFIKGQGWVPVPTPTCQTYGPFKFSDGVVARVEVRKPNIGERFRTAGKGGVYVDDGGLPKISWLDYARDQGYQDARICDRDTNLERFSDIHITLVPV